MTVMGVRKPEPIQGLGFFICKVKSWNHIIQTLWVFGDMNRVQSGPPDK